VTVTDNSGGVAGTTQTVSLSGNGVTPPTPTAPTVVADNFNRGNANTLGANWQQVIVLANAAVRVNASQASAAILGSAYFNTVGGSLQGAGFTFANATVNNAALYLKATGATPTSPPGPVSGQLQNAIRVQYNGGNVTIGTTTNGNANAPTYATPAGGVISTGGVLVNGNKLQAVVDTSGKVWIWKVTGPVATPTTTLLTPTGVQLPNVALWTTGGGKVGMFLPTGGRVDDFVQS
jgi:hypothetical protein